MMPTAIEPLKIDLYTSNVKTKELTLEEIDKKILEKLEKDGPTTFTQLLEIHNVKDTLARSIKRLREGGLIIKRGSTKKNPYVIIEKGRFILSSLKKSEAQTLSATGAQKIAVKEIWQNSRLSGYTVLIPPDISNWLTAHPKRRDIYLPGLLSLAFNYLAAVSSLTPWVEGFIIREEKIDDKPFFLFYMPHHKYPNLHNYLEKACMDKEDEKYGNFPSTLLEKTFEFLEAYLANGQIPGGVFEKLGAPPRVIHEISKLIKGATPEDKEVLGKLGHDLAPWLEKKGFKLPG